MTAQGAPGIRERNRAEITAAILAAARRQLVTEGAAALSLRAIARELGMASSAVYRYFPSRDDLLTRLIVEAYDSLGAHVEAAEARVARRHSAARFRAIGRAVRQWALAHEHEYALIYGSPVPGYSAPADTVGPASRVANLLIAILADGPAAQREWPPVPASARRAMAPITEIFQSAGAGVPPELVLRALMAWQFLFGAVTFELFGHLHNVITTQREPESPFFDAELDRIVALLGLA
jgi:AcrR family transcriptional regulator